MTNLRQGLIRYPAMPSCCASLFLYLTVFCLATVTDTFAREAIPGARYPAPEDFRGDWSGPGTPYHVRADFDGNGLIDDVWVLIQKPYPWRIQIFLAQPNNKSELDLIEENRNPLIPPQQVVLSVVTPPSRFITFHDVQIKGCVPNEQDDMGPGCTATERKETIVNLPGLRYCIVNGGCATYLWSDQYAHLVRITSPVLPVVNVTPNAFVGRRYSGRVPEVLGVLWQGWQGVWTAANHSEYTVSKAGFINEKETLIRYLWLDKFLTTDPYDVQGYEIRYAVPVKPYPSSARYDVDSCKMNAQDKTIVAIVDDLPNGEMRALQAWSLDVDTEKLMPVDIKDLDCRDRKW